MKKVVSKVFPALLLCVLFLYLSFPKTTGADSETGSAGGQTMADDNNGNG